MAEEALEAVGNGYVGRTIECECGGFMEYRGRQSVVTNQSEWETGDTSSILLLQGLREQQGTTG